MTVAVSDSSKRFHGAGSGGPFTWTWRFLVNSDIDVFLISEPDEDHEDLELRTSLVEGVDYTLAGAGSYTGGSLILNVNLAVGTDLVIDRNTDLLQMVSIRNQGNNFRPEIHEDVFDHLTMIAQDQERRIDLLESQTFTVNITQGAVGIASIVPVDTAAGDAIVNLPASGTVTIIKTSDDANTVDYAVTGGGQTIDAYDPLSGDGDFIQFTLIGTKWRRTG